MDEKQENIEQQKCHHCEKPAIGKYNGLIPLCVDCYKTMAQADFLAQQANHNQMAWLATYLNSLEQQLYVNTGGLLPLQQFSIPKPPSPSIDYKYNNIQVTDSNIGIVNSGDLLTIDTSIEVINNQGDKELANVLKELSEAIINNEEINSELKNEISKLISFISTEASRPKEKRNIPIIGAVLNQLALLIPTANAAWEIWERVEPILRELVG